MKKRFRFLFPLVVASLSLSGCFIEIVDKDKDGDDSGSGEVVDEGYYKGYDLTKTGGRLINELQKNCWDKHTQWVTYGQLNNYYNKTSDHESIEAIAKGSKTNQYFYTGKEAAGYGTREHVWPCANSSGLWVHDKPQGGAFSPHYVDNTYYVGGGSDLYHVRTCNSDVNTARGNSRFVSFDSPEFINEKDSTVDVGESGGKWTIKLYGASKSSAGKYEFASRSEPADQMKGDIARIILYIYVHYSERGFTPSGGVTKGGKTFEYSNMTAALTLTSIMGYDSEERCKEVLKEWNKLDEPSQVEKLRNDTVQKIQGNRNPFVDHPELVDKICQ